MANRVNGKLTLEGARIIFRNFEGRESQYNKKGQRNFSVILSEEQGERLKEDGWNVKYLQARDDSEDVQAYLPVEVSFKNYPPKVIIVATNGKRQLDEDTVSILDWADIEKVDIIIRPYNWKLANGNSGVKAYAQSLWIILAEDEFERKYREIPDETTPINMAAMEENTDGDDYPF